MGGMDKGPRFWLAFLFFAEFANGLAEFLDFAAEGLDIATLRA